MSCSTGLLELSGQSGQRRMSQRQEHHPDRHSRQCAQEARGVLAGRTRGNEPARRNGCRDTRPRGRDQPKLHAMFTDLHSAGGRMLTVVNASACATTTPAFRRPSCKGYSAPSCSPAAARTAPAVPDWAWPSARKSWTRATAPSRPSICLMAARRGWRRSTLGRHERHFQIGTLSARHAVLQGALDDRSRRWRVEARAFREIGHSARCWCRESPSSNSCAPGPSGARDPGSPTSRPSWRIAWRPTVTARNWWCGTSMGNARSGSSTGGCRMAIGSVSAST